jgi:FMN phosphatase YigB (HAD superfamily)
MKPPIKTSSSLSFWHVPRARLTLTFLHYLWCLIESSLKTGFSAKLDSLGDIPEWLKKHNHCSVYSFDVFDTLLRRRIHPPELVRQLVAEHAAGCLAQMGVQVTPEEILTERASCEKELLAKAIAGSNDPECRLDDVLAGMLRAINHDGLLKTEHLVDYEVGLEEKAAEPMPRAVAALAHLKSMGKRVICISDSYLSSSQMKRILETHGLMGYIDQVYVSSDIGKRKSTGKLFQHVLEAEGTKFVHIGDNYTSDYVIPRRIGIEALWFHSADEERRKRRLQRLLKSANKIDYLNAVIGGDQKKSKGLYAIGYHRMGPPLTVFVHNVAQQALKDGIEELFFVARDGYILKKIYDILRRTIYAGTIMPPSKYLCISRYVIQSILLSDRGRGNAHVPSTERQEASLSEPDARKLLRDYLVSIGFMGKRKVALVDAQVEVVTQSVLDTLFEGDLEYPHVYGYYFNIANIDKTKAAVVQCLPRVKGVIGDPRTCSKYELPQFSRFALLIESLTHPNHGLTVGYRHVNGKTRPVFMKTVQESRYPVTRQVLEGVISYVNDYAGYFELVRFEPCKLLNSTKAAVKQWISLPPRGDAEALNGLFNIVSWPTLNEVYIVANMERKDALLPHRSLKKVRSSLWPQASLALLPGRWATQRIYNLGMLLYHVLKP